MHTRKVCQIIASGLLVLILEISGAWTHKNRECGLLDSNNENVPWIANIYQSNGQGGHEYICSGTIVARKIILTAARCFYDDLTREVRNTTFVVSVGQRHKAFSSNGNENGQLREISHENIFITKQYTGMVDKYTCNIAIVKLNREQKFELNAVTKRACVYWDNDFAESDLQVDPPQLKLVVWGNDNNAAYTVLQPSYIDFDTCNSLVPTDFQPFLTYDKMCAQVQGLHTEVSTGSGLYVLNKAKNRWYLIGVASEATSSNSKTYITFIKIQPHLNWISNNAFLHIE